MTSPFAGDFDSYFTDAVNICTYDMEKASLDARSRYFQCQEFFHLKESSLGVSNPNVSRTCYVGERPTSIGKAPREIIYMDVGCWTGNGGRDGWPRHRHFGIVCGRVAVLCAFGVAPSYYPHSTKFRDSITVTPDSPFYQPNILIDPPPSVSRYIDPLVQKTDEIEAIIGFLTSMEDVFQRNNQELFILAATCLTSSSPDSLGADPTRISVFLGDLHASVVTDRTQAHFPGPPNMEFLHGRLRPPSPIATSFPPPPTPFPTPTPESTLEIINALEPFNPLLLHPMNPNAIVDAATMDRWFDLYYGVGQLKGAEIFQNAGQDLNIFLDQLIRYHNLNQPGPSPTPQLPVSISQLGDLFDLWIGFECGFDEHGALFPSGDTNDRRTEEPVLQFAHFWMQRTLHTQQGPSLRKLLNIASLGDNSRTPIVSRFVYGNHDNYRRFSSKTSQLPGAPFFNAPSHIRDAGLWAEHGHQSDTSNSDAVARKGWSFTQAAYYDTRIRSVEGRATWYQSSYLGQKIPRLLTMEHAIQVCIDNGCGIYVLGHTHEPMLKRITIH